MGNEISKPRAPPNTIRQIAQIRCLAEDQPRKANVNSPGSKKVLAIIQKCLDRANHAGTPEAEVQACLRMSSRLMEQHNITQADLVATEVATRDSTTLGGQSVVRISLNPKLDGKVIQETWVEDVVTAMLIFFDCKAYSTKRSTSIEWTFYGIAANTLAAAMSFEMVHNLVQQWSMKKKGVKNSYRLGAGSGLIKIAQKEKKEEERRAQAQEAADLAARQAAEVQTRERELARLSGEELAGGEMNTNGSHQDQKRTVKMEEDPEQDEAVEDCRSNVKVEAEDNKENVRLAVSDHDVDERVYDDDEDDNDNENIGPTF